MRHGTLCGFLGSRLPDLGGSGSNVMSNVSGDRCERFIEAATRSFDLLLDAEGARYEETMVEKLDRALRIN